jgi:hypothetical protein
VANVDASSRPRKSTKETHMIAAAPVPSRRTRVN